jgi:hypothetical protein
MRRQSTGGILIRKGVRAGIVLSTITLFSATSWAQRGTARGSGAPSTRMPMPQRHIAPPSTPPMRQAPTSMPRPQPPAARRLPMPRPEPRVSRPVPSPVRPARPMPPAARDPRPAPAQPRSTDTNSSDSSSNSTPFTLDNLRRPVYTHTTSTKEMMASQRARANSRTYSGYTGQGFGSWGGYGWPAYGLGSFGWSSLFIGGYFCDPFSLMMLYGDPMCFVPGAYLNGYGPMFGYNPFLVNFGGFGLFSSTNLFFGAGFLGQNCRLCSSPAFDPFTMGLYGASPYDPYKPALGSSVSISEGDLPGLVSTTDVPEPSPAKSDGSSSYTYVTPSSTGTPITLVLTDGTKIEATQYQLSANGMFRYITTSGRVGKISFTQVDIKATMKANSDKGVDFLVPKNQQPESQDQEKQPRGATISTK